jgi:hypothetical protein
MSGRAAKLVRRATNLLIAEGKIPSTSPPPTRKRQSIAHNPAKNQIRVAKRHFKKLNACDKGALRAYVEHKR